MLEKGSSKLHEVVSASFNRSPNNLIFTHDLKQVYSLLLICLDLKERPRDSSKNIFNALSKSFPYSFSVQDAVEKMKDLQLHVDLTTTSVHIKYAIKPDLAYNLLTLFMDAKLLHTPADRTRDAPKENVLLQPTPKGTAILQHYVSRMGLKIIPPVLKSSFNSMQLFTFERSSTSDAILHSDSFIQLLFVNAMGPEPNVWQPTNQVDKIPPLSAHLGHENIFSFESTVVDFCRRADYSVSCYNGNKADNKYERKELREKPRESPFAHRFFTNPDSDAHIQYYISEKGVRLFESKMFGKKVLIDYSFTTKALWQWLMDCTDIMYPKEAISIAALFLKKGLITPILLPPSLNIPGKFAVSKNAYYTLSNSGWQIVRWMQGLRCSRDYYPLFGIKRKYVYELRIDTTVISCDSSKERPKKSDGSDEVFGTKQTMRCSRHILDLRTILKDPGMRYLFRRHLEREFCTENFDVYLEIKKFSKRMTILKKLLDFRTRKQECAVTSDSFHFSQKTCDSIDSRIITNIDECLAVGCHIFLTYIASGAPFQVNIDHELRTSIISLMTDPGSSLKQVFENPFSDEAEIAQPFCISPNDYISSMEAFMTPITRQRKIIINSLKTNLDPETPSSLTNYVTGDLNDKGCSQIPLSSSPTAFIVSNLKILKELYVLLDRVAKHIYRLMNIDSIPKFLNSDLYKEAINFIDTRKIDC
ncbi:ABR176Cp [Eremothecium gossypii ATCC 10895]|uniref:ABR176Cp n=1 Tax=Eremothecium gossypii (strain ATCC 10895 / CBS 109.51 / FGSC 9923 / NRRL Y-1056) TaxID=284811 RepID=Q75D47_EREGS|nr:ABR176Cp [Eremothecium gossypii ATCC 10895]AAS50948.2 ABR176Cp [Eremothecium gossypii ATCC 10895]